MLRQQNSLKSIVEQGKYINIFQRIIYIPFICQVVKIRQILLYLMKILLFISLCILSSFCDFQPRNITVSIDQASTSYQFDYSQDHKYLGIMTDSQLSILYTQTGKQIQSPIKIANFTFQSFSFNQQSNYLAVGSTAGHIKIYKLSNNIFIQDNKQIRVNQKPVTSLCWNSNSSHIIYGGQEEIFVWNIQTQQYINSTFEEKIYSISCSPSQQNRFVVGGGGNLASKLTLYNFNQTEILSQNTSPGYSLFTTGVLFNQNGSTIYRIQNDGSIWSFDVNVFEKIYIGNASKPSYKIRVSKDGRVIAIGGFQYAYILIDSSSIKQTLLKEYIVQQTIQIKYSSIALSNVGSFLFYIDSAGKPVVSNQCKDNQYADQNGTCIDCNPSCSICDGNTDNCFSCSSRHFLDGYLCDNCSSGCLQCNNATDCTFCENGTYLFNSICQNCVRGCSWCDNGLTCNSCDSVQHYVLNNSLCICGPYYYDNGIICLACLDGCIQCNSENCTQCDTQKHWQPLANQCKCETFYYQNGQDCLNCILGCQTCLNGTSCIQCDSSRNFVLKQDICSCIDSTFFLDNNKCQYCSAKFRFCSQCTFGGCTACQSNFYLDNGSCLCKEGYFQGINFCQACSFECKKCQNAKKCIECFEGYIVEEDICQEDGSEALIVVLVIVGIVVIGAAMCIISKCIRMRRSPARKDNYEEL